jgi:hypothetical protein
MFIQHHQRSKFAVAFFLIVAASSADAEERSYTFVGDRPAYSFMCGECSGPPYDVRSQIEGSFEVDFDFENGVGTLQSLNVQLSAVEGFFYPTGWRPIQWDVEFFDARIYGDGYRPPYTGVLTPATYRPLGDELLTAEHLAPFVGVPWRELPTEIRYWYLQGIGFEPAPANAWVLYFDGLTRHPDGQTVSGGASFLLYLQGDRAELSYEIPVSDAVTSLRAASAMLIPEPSALIGGYWIACCLLASRHFAGLAAPPHQRTRALKEGVKGGR